MAGSYAVQFHDKAKLLPMREQIFDRFESLYAFVITLDRKNSADVINVHLPAHATVTERERIMALGLRIH